jgi:amino acid permease
MSFISQLFATTNVEKLRELGSRKILRRALTAKDLVAIGLGTMIGGGIFTTIGTGVKARGRPSLSPTY